MKKTILYLCIVSSISFSTKAQMIDASKVPQTVKSTFERQHPGVTPQWEFEDEKFDAEFKKDGKKYQILYDRKGNSAEKIDIDNLPVEIKNYIASQHNGEKLKKAKKLVSANGEVSYLGVLSSQTIHFDAKGKIIEDPVK